ncbi:MAG: hypothetical protein SGPRY_002839 [Prymnesium sp.]
MALPHSACCEAPARGGVLEVVGRRFPAGKAGLEALNGRWLRCPYAHEGRECFSKSAPHLNGEGQGEALFLYFRSLEKRWVVSRQISPRGPLLAASVGEERGGAWVRPTSWVQDVRIWASEVTAEGGHLRCGVVVGGCSTVEGSSPSSLDNGTYLLQVPSYRYDKEEGVYWLGSHSFTERATRPEQIPLEERRYVLTSPLLDPTTNLPLRRHLSYKPEANRWEISPLCDGWEPSTCVSVTERLEGGWCRRVLALGGEGEFHNGRYARGGKRAQGGEADGSGSEVEEAEEGEGEEQEEEGEEAESAFVSPPAWNESSHEFALLGSDRIKLLSLDRERMAATLHPHLTSLLRNNRVELGESLASVNASHAEVLSLLTGHPRTRKSASSILGGEFFLTGDSIFKLHAIHARVACGLPVVLSGECGCGKTFALRYLSEWVGAELLVLNVHGGTREEEIYAILQEAEERLSEKRGWEGEGSKVGEAREEEEEGSVGGELAIGGEGWGERLLREEGRRVFVFFDELNACAHVGLMAEAITRHSIGGKPLHPHLRIFAAINPYRRRAETSGSSGASSGLIFGLGGGAHDDMAGLVYRVHPIPRSLQQLTFDFGFLEPSQEAQYIRALLKRQLGSLRGKGMVVGKVDAMCALSLLLASQGVLRDFEAEPSVVSLRDAARTCELLGWFAMRILKRDGGAKPTPSPSPSPISPLAASLVLGLAFVYMYRLPSSQARASYWAALRQALAGTRSGFTQHRAAGPQLSAAWRVLAEADNGYGPDAKRSAAQALSLARDFDASGFQGFLQEGRFEAVLAQARRLVSKMEVEAGVAMNEALSENLFVSCVCVLNLLPLFIVGKPGTSKTLAMQDSNCHPHHHLPHLQVLSNNLQGSRSPHPFWRDFPAIHVFPYQCSPMSASDAIQRQFDIACRFQLHATSIVSVLLLDEVGLAEHSPDMPLKVLHAMLVKPPVAIVGLSNWALDSAKMNRAICIRRTEPTPVELELTANSIAGGLRGLRPSPPQRGVNGGGGSEAHGWLQAVCHAYHTVYSSQQRRAFLGMRDLYACVKKVSASCRGGGLSPQEEADLVEEAIKRNFGGKESELHRVLVAFHGHRLSSFDPHGLTQGMGVVQVTGRLEASATYDERLELSLGEVGESCVVRRGAVVLSVDHGHGCVVEGEVEWERPCDLIQPGDVLIAVECIGPADSLQQEAKGAPIPLAPSARGEGSHSWREDVDSVFTANKALRRLGKNKFSLTLLRREDCIGEVSRVRSALLALASISTQTEKGRAVTTTSKAEWRAATSRLTEETLVTAGLSSQEAQRAQQPRIFALKVRELESNFHGETTRFSWATHHTWRRSGRSTGWQIEEAIAERERQARLAVMIASRSGGEERLAAEKRKAEAEALRAKESRAQQASRKRQEELYAKQAAIAGISTAPAVSSSQPPSQEEPLPLVEGEEGELYAADTRVTLGGRLVDEIELRRCVERGEVSDPITGRIVLPENFANEEGGVDELAYELARRRVGLPARSGMEDVVVYDDPSTRRPVVPESFTRGVVVRGEDGEEMRRELDPQAYELARRRVGLPGRKWVGEGEGSMVMVPRLGKRVPEASLTRVVIGTGGARMSLLQRHTLYGPSAVPTPCAWRALFGVCARLDCQACDHGALVPPRWVSTARGAGCVRPPTWYFMREGFSFPVRSLQLVRDALADRNSRNLMLLTRHAAALRLLFDSGMVDEGRAEVLFGSRFPDDVSELQLVRQVNRVKVAMGEGSTVVLVNHDNIYEALYDVLNQRYLLKRDPTSGRTKRYLRGGGGRAEPGA